MASATNMLEEEEKSGNSTDELKSSPEPMEHALSFQKTEESIQIQKGKEMDNGLKKEEKVIDDERLRRDDKKIRAGGDFLVQVHIIEGRDLTGKDGAPHPVVTTTIFDLEKSTKIKDITKNSLWDQVMYFELKELEPDQLSQGKALIQVFDAKWSLGTSIFAKELIGAFQFDLSWIYHREHHEVYNEWVPLMNNHTDDDEENVSAIQGVGGYLKLSITVLGPGDEQHTHDDDEELSKGSSQSGMTLVSPGIEQVGF